jgi:hypothetical protein
VFKGKTVHQQADFKFIDVEEKLRLFLFFNTIVTWLIQRVRVAKIIEHAKSVIEQNHSIDVLITRLFSILFWLTP